MLAAAQAEIADNVIHLHYHIVGESGWFLQSLDPMTWTNSENKEPKRFSLPEAMEAIMVYKRSAGISTSRIWMKPAI